MKTEKMDYTEYKNKLNDVREWALDCGLCEELVKSIQIPTDISKDYSYIKHRFVNTHLTDLSQEIQKPPKEDLEKNSEMYKRLFPQYFEDGINNIRYLECCTFAVVLIHCYSYKTCRLVIELASTCWYIAILYSI